MTAAWSDPWTDATYASLNMLEPNKLAAVAFVEPEAKVELKNTGNLSWRWTFEWENNRYDWSRASSSLLGGERAYTLSIVSERQRPSVMLGRLTS